MGRTVPSYRMVLEHELHGWKRFSDFLRKEEQVYFEEMMDACRLYASYAGAACRPIPSEAIFMSILQYHQKQIRELKKQLAQLQAEKTETTSTTGAKATIQTVAAEAGEAKG